MSVGGRNTTCIALGNVYIISEKCYLITCINWKGYMAYPEIMLLLIFGPHRMLIWQVIYICYAIFCFIIIIMLSKNRPFSFCLLPISLTFTVLGASFSPSLCLLGTIDKNNTSH